jgi:predicted nucleic acid-binding protein
MTRFIDTNVFLRYVTTPETEEQRRKHDASEALLQRVSLGEESVITTESVIAEILFVLCSPRQYGVERGMAVDLVRPLLELSGLELPGKTMYLRALDIFRTHTQLDVEDAISVAFMERRGVNEIWSYDKDFDRVPDVVRLEPAG